MDAATQRALTAHTRRFYEEHAAHFSATRDHAWAGWQRVIEGWRPTAPLHVLDVGCGNGRLASWLSRAHPAALRYTGVDACEALLEVARGRCPAARLVRADLSLAVDASLPRGPFDLVCAFGVLHHIAGLERRRELVAALAQRTARGGRLALAFWRFAERSRFARRRLDWSAAPGIDEARLEPGDHLLAWGEDGAARYCHASDDAEIDSLVARSGLRVCDDFEADGREGDLNRYLVLERP